LPWPDFTELSFGFCFLREFERQYVAGGSFPRAPDFISQYKEATEGHDVEIALEDSTPVFLQFKRSMVLTRRNAREITCGDYADPKIYRMYLHKKDDYRQHEPPRVYRRVKLSQDTRYGSEDSTPEIYG
jgi:hypothetical protein